MSEHFNCISKILVPDNLKSAVIKADRLDPQINKLYGEMAKHYDIIIEPARVKKQKTKQLLKAMCFTFNAIFWPVYAIKCSSPLTH